MTSMSLSNFEGKRKEVGFEMKKIGVWNAENDVNEVNEAKKRKGRWMRLTISVDSIGSGRRQYTGRSMEDQEDQEAQED